MTAICADCERAVHSRGYCYRHYLRHLRNGDFTATIFPVPIRAVTRCSMEGCERPVRRYGLCFDHMREKPERCSGRTAKGAHCAKPAVALGLCKMHHGKLRYQRKKAKIAGKPVMKVDAMRGLNA